MSGLLTASLGGWSHDAQGAASWGCRPYGRTSTRYETPCAGTVDGPGDEQARGREDVSESFGSAEAAHQWLEEKELAAKTGVDPGQTLREYVEHLVIVGPALSIQRPLWIRTQPGCGSEFFRRSGIFRWACSLRDSSTEP